MAIKHIKKYFLEVQSQYFEMLADTKELDESYAKNLIEEVHYNQAIDLVKRLGENYNRLAYIMMLLEMPNKKDKSLKYIHQNECLFEYLSKDSKKCVCEENDSVLNEIRKISRGAKIE